MKQLFFVLTLISTLSISAAVYAERLDENYTPFFVFPDLLIYRPLGLAATIAGTGLFVASTPFAALANIAPPHKAFEKTADILIYGPGRYTFKRPVGNISLTHY